jgi:hypothetical protein
VRQLIGINVARSGVRIRPGADPRFVDLFFSLYKSRKADWSRFHGAAPGRSESEVSQ